MVELFEILAMFVVGMLFWVVASIVGVLFALFISIAIIEIMEEIPYLVKGIWLGIIKGD